MCECDPTRRCIVCTPEMFRAWPEWQAFFAWRAMPAVEPPPGPRAPRRPLVKTARCSDCNRRVVYGPRCGTCAQLHRWRTYGRSGELRVVRDVMAPIGELSLAASKSWGKR